MKNIVIYGYHSCVAALRNPARVIEQAFLTAEREDLLNEVPELQKIRCHLADRKNLALRLPAGAVSQGIALKVQPLPTHDINYLTTLSKPHKRVLILDQITDPQNVGAIMRSCKALGVDAIISCENHTPDETGTLVKTASGAFETLPRIVVSNLVQGIEELKKIGFWCYGLSEHATKTIDQVDLKGNVALIMGSEGEGLRHLTTQHCDDLVKLNTVSEFPTLNVSAASAIAMYEVKKAQDFLSASMHEAA